MGLQGLSLRSQLEVLLDIENEFLTDTKGEGVMNHSFLEFRPYSGTVVSRKKWCFSIYGKW